MSRADLVDRARTYLGVPWRHLGRTRAGVDCIGLVLLAAADAGLTLPDPAPYQREPQGQRLLDGIRAHAQRVVVAEPGDILVFRMGIYGGHVGIATVHRTYGGPGVLHAYAPRRHVVEQQMDGEMQRALAAVFRLTEG
jgi:cell wall-associated NlpC family hydrolase